MTDPEAKKQTEELKARVGDYMATFSSAEGRRVLKDMRKSFGRYSFDPNPFIMARNEGKREVILEIEDMIALAKKPKLIEELFATPEDEGYQP